MWNTLELCILFDRILMLVKNLYVLWGRRCFLISVNLYTFLTNFQWERLKRRYIKLSIGSSQQLFTNNQQKIEFNEIND